MSKNIRLAEYSNFLFTSGDKILLDLLAQRLWPLFKEELKSNRGEIKAHRFIQVNAAFVGDEPVIYGRFVQQMTLKARQRLRGDNIRQSKAQMDSDPSSIFVLTLRNHKLILIPEIPRSPRTKSFKNVLDKLLERDWQRQLINRQQKYKKRVGKERLSRQEHEEIFANLTREYPRINLEINPIAAKSAVESVVDSFDEIRKLKITYYRTNNEDYETDEQLVQAFGKSVARMNSKQAVQEYVAETAGLDRTEVENMVGASIKTGGNSSFRIEGNTNGIKVVKTDDHIQAAVPVKLTAGDSLDTVASRALTSTENLVKNKVISIGEEADGNQKNKTAALISELNRE